MPVEDRMLIAQVIEAEPEARRRPCPIVFGAFRQNAGCHVRKFVEQRLDQFRPAERFVLFDGEMELVAA